MADPKSNALQSAFNHLTSASKTATGLIKTAVDAKLLDAVKEINQEIIAAQGSNIAAQQEHAAMLDEVRKLKAEIAQFEDWEDEKARYELKQMDTGVSVYALKPSQTRGEPEHEACPNCFQERKIRILQPTHDTNYWSARELTFRVHECASCKSKFEYGGFNARTPTVRRDPGSWRI